MLSKNVLKMIASSTLILGLIMPAYNATAATTATPTPSAKPTVATTPTCAAGQVSTGSHPCVAPVCAATQTSTTAHPCTPATPAATSKPAPKATSVPAPKSPGVAAIQSENNIIVSWTLPKPTPKKQSITISPSDGFTSLGGNVDIKLRKYVFNGLTAGTAYTVTLKTSSPSKTYRVTVRTLAAPLDPVNVRVNRLPDTLAVYWDSYKIDPTTNLQSKPDTVLVTLASPGVPSIVYTAPNPNSTSYRIPNISKALSYTVSVQFKNATGMSNPVSIEVPATIPNQPSKPTVTVLTTSNAQIDWTYDGPTVTGQSLKIISSNGGKRNGDILTPRSNATTFLVDGLSPGGKYVFELTLSNRDGSSKPVQSDPVSMLVPPTVPLNFKVKPADSSAILTWDAPLDNGGTPVTSYKIEYRLDGASTYTTVLVPAPAATKTITPLLNSTKYFFKITAITAFASSPTTAESDVTPATIPLSVTNVVATAAASSATITWTAPAKDGGSPITQYLVTYGTTIAQVSVLPGQTTLTTTISGLVNGTSYTFKVQAVNAIGSSVGVSSLAVIPYTTSTAPINLVLTPGAGTITAVWAAPVSLGGMTLSSYNVQYKLATDSAWTDLAAPTTALTRTITGLTNGANYSVRVSAVTGTTIKYPGAYTDPVTAMPVSSPTIPLNLVATPGNLSANLTWSPPASNGGSVILYYKVMYKASSSGTWIQTATNPTDTNYVIPSLLSGTTYNFTVTAVNAIGAGVTSAVANATPSTIPNAPASLTATVDAVPVAGQVKLNWVEAPLGTGVSPVTGYKVEYKLSSASTWTTANPSILAVSYTMTGLTSGQSYDFQVSAINAIGTSLPRGASVVAP